MDKNERDMHFQEFAKLLWHDLAEIIGEPLVTSSANFAEFEQKANQIKQLFAQRAYDLVYHTICNVEYNNLQRLLAEDHVPHIPDLTQWPDWSD